MKTRRIGLAGITTMIFAAAGAGPACALQGEEIKALIGGKRVYLSTPLKIELPLIYQQDGSVTGNIAKFSMASMFAPKETGRWWVEGNRMCQKFPTWYKGRQFCFTIEKLGGNRISWVRDDGYSGTARIEQ